MWTVGSRVLTYLGEIITLYVLRTYHQYIIDGGPIIIHNSKLWTFSIRCLLLWVQRESHKQKNSSNHDGIFRDERKNIEEEWLERESYFFIYRWITYSPIRKTKQTWLEKVAYPLIRSVEKDMIRYGTMLKWMLKQEEAYIQSIELKITIPNWNHQSNIGTN